VAEGTGEVRGRVYLQGRAEHSGAIANAGNIGALSAADGSFTLSGLTPGTYAISLSRPGYLPAQFTDLQIGEGDVVHLPDVLLLGGDLNQDGRVDTHDLSLMAGSLGTEAALADLTGDGIVDIQDLVIVGLNFGRPKP
jgi:hypothetical protein